MPTHIQSDATTPRRLLLKVGLYSLLSSTVMVTLLYLAGWARPHSLIFATGTDLVCSITNPGFTFFGRELPLNYAWGWPFLVYLINHLGWNWLLAYLQARPKA